VIPEIGQFSLVLALCLALVQASLPLAGAWTGRAEWMAFARPAAAGQFVFIMIAFATLEYAFLNDDFSVLFVAQHSNSALPTFYKFTAAWGGHEGSMLCWITVLAIWTLAVAAGSRSQPEQFASRVLGVLGIVSAGIIAFALFTSNPFLRLAPAPADGNDLNPLLQDPGMIIHPPTLYVGYVGMAVPFAFAVAALLTGRLDKNWAKWTRPWTVAAWIFLTCGITLGSWWSYYELGWGGWWFWDPVENSSFMPWLLATALLHSLAVTERRGIFKSWTVLLAIAAFSLSLLGTFLTRSGVLVSVHAFAADPTRGMFILGLLAAYSGLPLMLYAFRARSLEAEGGFKLVSREAFLLANNILFVIAAGTVLFGTLSPLIVDALGYGKISVGPPYFDAVFVPLMAPALFLMGVGPLARWKRASLPELAILLRWSLGISLATGILVPLVMGRWSAMVGFGIALAAWIALTCLISLRKSVKTRSHYGMVVAHFGVAVFVVGVTLVKGYESEKDVRMRPGDSTELAGYVFTLEEIGKVQGPNYTAARGVMSVTRNGKPVATLRPEKRIYTVQQMPMTEAAIDTGLTRDLYVSLGEPLDNGEWLVRVQEKPFVDWIWGGCLIMALGGLLAASDRRYRVSIKEKIGKVAGAIAA
jgi:cytochrome c-type biogenesis protein CcmF